MTRDSRYSTTRRTALKTTLGAATLSLTVAGCLSNDPDAADFRIGAPWKPTRDPLDGGTLLRRLGITEALVSVDHDATPAPGLATDWERVDERRWRFDLREGVTFHDGTSLDASATVASLRRTADATAFTDVPIDAIEAEDETAVVVETETPFAPLPAHLSRDEAVILSPDAIGDDGSIEDPVGTGPFALESFRSGAEIRSVRHDEYHGREPSLESVRYEVVEDDQTRRMKLESGELEMARILPQETVDPLESDGDIDIHVYEVPRIRFLTFDTTSAPFDDRRVRRAVHRAIDREAIAESILEGLDEPAVGPFSSAITDWANPDLDADAHAADPERARSLLSDAGWTTGSSDVRTRDGEELAVEFLTYDARSLPLIAEAMQDHLAAVGIDVDVTTVEYSSMVDRVSQGSFDGYLTSWGTFSYPDPDRLAQLFHSTDAALHHGYENDRVDDLLEEGRELTDREARRERYHEVQSIVLEDAPIAVLTNFTNVVATAAGVDGYEPHPTESRYGLESITVGEE
ncbi:extracellular solute-binding protein family 5 [Haloterrigena turkmenica DSM 5511]|uniref:Extracellular solute-binding protein family 5 n=1 Tax=Haloterrigena turkmenica (strain ATCC 51198 / DSM 5511 / JCM 9101 / NCIMB 13204 / VKM B-1734 / 4k) TaxID=543526 RepID=D2RV82_HALTV|nr:ABC transporter substrate-binding protein [Haloterrigena turkmenica]ADB61283.1 extracellular solute-binding protein family 5 [Haloterrigena turkmenica DSM 5511]